LKTATPVIAAPPSPAPAHAPTPVEQPPAVAPLPPTPAHAAPAAHVTPAPVSSAVAQTSVPSSVAPPVSAATSLQPVIEAIPSSPYSITRQPAAAASVAPPSPVSNAQQPSTVATPATASSTAATPYSFPLPTPASQQPVSSTTEPATLQWSGFGTPFATNALVEQQRAQLAIQARQLEELTRQQQMQFEAQRLAAAALATLNSSAIQGEGTSVSAAEQTRQRELREIYARYIARRDMLSNRVNEARDRLLSVQKALAIAREQAEEVGAASAEMRSLESAVCRASDRVGILRESLAGDEAALASRLSQQAARLRMIRSDADAVMAALRASELEGAAAASARDGSLDVQSLQNALAVAKAEQIGALRRAQEEHEIMVQRSASERAAKLNEAARRAEANVSSLYAEERSLRKRAAELSDAVRAKRAEAEAAAARRKALVTEVDQLREAIRAAEAADIERMVQLQGEVSQIEGQVALLKSSPLTVTAGSDGAIIQTPGVPAALAKAEHDAREAERAKWANAVEAETTAGERKVEEVKNEGRKRYLELVRSIEQRYTSEFESALAQIQDRQERDATESRQLEMRLREMRNAVDIAREQRAKLEQEAQVAQSRVSADVSQMKGRLYSLKQALRDAWREKGADASETAAFLQRVLATLPFSPQLQRLYENKLEQLRTAAPILRSVTRREVLLFRLQHIRRAVAEAEATPTPTSGAAASPAANAARTGQMQRLQADYASATSELERVSETLLRDLSEWEKNSGGQPFLYRGQRLLDVVLGQAAANSSATSSTGLLLTSSSSSAAGVPVSSGSSSSAVESFFPSNLQSARPSTARKAGTSPGSLLY